jgi:uncharacterized protein with FMN-binding domain
VKRVILSIAGTIASLAALLGFKTHSSLQQTTLPSASQSTTQPTSGGGGSTINATPQQSSGSSGSSSSTGSSSSSSSSNASSGSSSTGSSSTTKTVVGNAEQDQYGVVQVQVTAKGKTITDVRFVQLTAYDQRSQEINSQAGPMLLQQTLDAQSANISGVSGATYTSTSYIQSLQSALDKL